MALTMTKSPLRLAKEALRVGRAGLDRYSHPNSRHDFTQAQLFALLVLRQFYRTDYRGMIAILRDSPNLQELLRLKRIPHYTTLCNAHGRLLKKTPLRNSKPNSLGAQLSLASSRSTQKAA